MESGIDEEQSSNPLYDFRQDYYKIVRWQLHMFSVNWMYNQKDVCFRILRDLYSNVSAFLTDSERKDMLVRLEKVRMNIRIKDAYRLKDAAFIEQKTEAEGQIDDDLFEAKNKLLDLLKEHNMLLPLKAADEDLDKKLARIWE